MKNETAIDELVFWKRFIDDKKEQGEKIPEQMNELLKAAEVKVLFYLMNKLRTDNDNLFSDSQYSMH